MFSETTREYLEKLVQGLVDKGVGPDDTATILGAIVDLPDTTALTGAGSASGDLFLVYDVSAGVFKKMTRTELLVATDAGLATHIADTSAAHVASAISSAATGDVAATDVQAAIAELASEKAPKASPTFTGTSTFPAGSFIDASGNVSCQGSYSGPNAGAFGGTDIVGGNDAAHPISLRASTVTLNVNGATTIRIIPQSGGHATLAPGVGDDNTLGWRKYDNWLKEDTHKWYKCESAATGAAVWTILN